MFAWFNKKQENYLPPVIKSDGSKTKIYVGVSGGVDSSVSAGILVNKGYDVTGVFMKTYYPPEIKCNWREERLDAIGVCKHLGVPFLECDLESEYKDNVFEYMVEGYRSGITPNPDVFCNKYVKFGGFLDWALQNGADYVATGHYAQHQLRNPVSKLKQERTWEPSFQVHKLVMGRDRNKDQTYFLYQLQQHQLERALFPIGDIEKSQVRKLAKKMGLFTADKKDSQGLCFVGPVDMHEFLARYIDEKPGDVLNTEGEIIGKHDGSFFLTIGQRTGFEIDPQHRTPDMPRMFIVGKNHTANTITVSADKHDSDTNTITIKQVSWVGEGITVGQTVDSRIRHRGKLLPATLQSVYDDQYTFSFDTTHDGVAQGQSLVLYRDNVCLGGGVII